tara:strand:- start:224 stop:649 length:426 start_codon:yes stop_codon:yes gene_type:complete
MIKKNLLIIVFIFFVSNHSFANWLEGNSAVFQSLDKITARIKTLELKIGEKNNFGILEILVKRCVYSKPAEAPESIAYISIIDNSKKQIQLRKTNIVFDGWMFASSPALNAMEHPVYDLVLIDCKNRKTHKKGSSSDSSVD